MSNRVKRKISHKTANLEWKEFMGGLQARLSFHEQKANELKPLIEDLQRLRDEGVELPIARKKAGIEAESIPA
jgi:hypothetical protein